MSYFPFITTNTNRYFQILFLILFVTSARSQTIINDIPFSKKIRVIVDNDFSGDPDGLFQLTHLLLSPSVDVRAIIGSHIAPKDFIDPTDSQANNAAQKAKEVMQLLKIKNNIPIVAGSNKAMVNDSTPSISNATNIIINEALRTDTKMPLYILCGAGLTEVASALLKQPNIAGKFIIVWIGGPEYTDAIAPPKASKIEYNLNIDIAAAMSVFNRSNVSIWQIPRNAYRQVIISHAQLLVNVKPKGTIGNYLYQELFKLMNKLGKIGETYILGDSPLVLLTALQTYFEADPASSFYQLKNAPLITKDGQYINNQDGRKIRVYHHLDVALLLNDFFAKLELHAYQTN